MTFFENNLKTINDNFVTNLRKKQPQKQPQKQTLRLFLRLNQPQSRLFLRLFLRLILPQGRINLKVLFYTWLSYRVACSGSDSAGHVWHPRG